MAQLRTFIALELSDDARRDLSRLARRLAAPDDGVRWIDAAAVHVTLKFLGDVEERDVPAIAAALDRLAAGAAPFEMRLRGVGCFPPRGNVRIVWAGIEEPSGGLMRLQAGCETALQPLGFRPEGRPYSPHITIGRVRDGRRSAELRSRLSAESTFAGATMPVKQVVLFESRLQRGGAQYIPLSRHVLRAETHLQNSTPHD